MRRGDFAAAWRVCDDVLADRMRRRLDCTAWPRHLQFVWRGESFKNKRVLVRCYHGLGDTLQFIRFTRALRRQAREVIVWAQPSLLSLVATAPGVDRVLPLDDGTPQTAYDVDIEVMELAHALRASPGSIAADIPYLHPAIDPGFAPDPAFLSIGVIWEAGNWDPRRSIPAPLIASLARRGVRLYSLQAGSAREEAAAIGAADIEHENVEVVGARMLALDLVVTVDTMAAHLAGALAVPCFALLHHDADWRWMSGERSVWYPSMRLFRQPRPGDWDAVIEAVRHALRRRTDHAPGAASPERTQASDVSA